MSFRSFVDSGIARRACPFAAAELSDAECIGWSDRVPG